MRVFLILFMLLPPAFGTMITSTTDSAVEIRVGENHVGPITGKTGFNLKVIQALFPNYQVKQSIRLLPNCEEPTIEVIKNRKVLLIISPDENQQLIGEVEILSGSIGNEFGPRVGWAYTRAFRDTSTPECFQEARHTGDVSICKEPESKHVYYVFTYISNLAAGTLTQNQVMGAERIEEIIWRAWAEPEEE